VRTVSRASLWLLASVLLVAVVVFAARGSPRSDGRAEPPPRSEGGQSAHKHAIAPGLHVDGNRLLDAQGQPVHFHGVNRSGTEYACIQGWGIFDGPSDARSVRALASWRINMVRIPINEDCWLGINGTDRRYSGATYRGAIARYVRRLHAHGMYAELALMWGAPGSARAHYQPTGPDEDHSPAAWASMARAYKDDPNVILAPWGETTVGWRCFTHGCNDENTYPSNEDGLPSCRAGCWYYRGAGMQEAVHLMRGAGYRGTIALPCIAYANVCQTVHGGEWGAGTWLKDQAVDPLHQIVAEAHVYGKNVCDTPACFNENYLPILKAGYPLIWGETGESYDASDCGSSKVAAMFGWADIHHVGYAAWAWNTPRTCSALIENYAGTPRAGYGTWVKAHYLSHPVRQLREHPRGCRSGRPACRG
jgi:endoglucanase